MKIKRKDLDQFNDEFSDFSLSSPARKIRRLDVGLPPIIEEDEHPEIAALREEPLMFDNFVRDKSCLRIEELSDSVFPSGDRPICENQERAIVLFKPVNVNSPFSQSQSSPLSLSVDWDVISGFKSEFLRENQSDAWLKSAEEDDEAGTGKNLATSENLAVIPWVPPRQAPVVPSMYVPQSEPPELMEAEDVGGDTMDIEDDSMSMNMSNQQPYGYGGGDAVHQWHQQHCMIPQMPQQTSTPITWFR